MTAIDMEDMKSKAIALLELGHEPESVAEQLMLPKKIVREWHKNLEPGSLIKLNANLHAAQTLAAELPADPDITPPNGTVAKLQTQLEKTALEAVGQISLTVATGDMVRAKTLQLCSDAISKLYLTFVIGKGAGQGPLAPTGGNETFRRLMRD